MRGLGLCSVLILDLNKMDKNDFANLKLPPLEEVLKRRDNINEKEGPFGNLNLPPLGDILREVESKGDRHSPSEDEVCPSGLDCISRWAFYDKRAESKENSSDYEGALSDYKIALGYNPSFGVGQFHLTRIYKKLGNKDESKFYRRWERKLNLKHTDIDSHMENSRTAERLFGNEYYLAEHCLKR